MKNYHITNHDRFAENYDTQVKEYNSYGHDVLFGMSFEYVKAGDSLLDLGIGTGLSSVHFAKINLEVTGIDGSEKMLEQCQDKDFARELIKHDLTELPFPWADGSFNHVICCGVFHFFGELNSLFKEVDRLMKPDGIFAFTIAGLTKSEAGSGKYNDIDFLETPTAWGVPIYRHTNQYIRKLASLFGYDILKEQKVLSDSGDPQADDLLFKVIVCRK